MTDINITKRINRMRRQTRGRAKISGTAERPRVTVFKSNTALYAQAIDDVSGVTLAAVNDAHLKTKGTKTDRATKAGEKLAELLKAKGVAAVVFDKAGFKYHGRVKAVAEALRAGGITL
ncbi:MAG: 50S ribosomal protein L18 [Candidatus Yanofskybacteria bacterium]|nr:50S ribosomal protein L18 [Candidatus Yanofskybacteria bacterium]